MARISTYPIISIPTLNDLLIGTDVENLNNTKNFSIGDISALIAQGFVPYVGATGNVNLGLFSIEAASFIVDGGLGSQFLKADGTLDSTAYTPQTRTLTINGVTYNLSANRSWDLNTIDTFTTAGTSGAATYVGKTLNIPVYQAQGAYITQLSGEATGVGPGNATVTLDNAAVIGKLLTGLNVTGGTVVSTDTILQAFGKVQNQINGLAGGVEYQGVWNAATNTPFLQSSVGVQGYYYVVNVAGTTNLNGITDWQVGDWAIFNGSTWDKVDNTDAVVSVNGYVGAVVLTASDVGAVPTTRTLTINGVGYNLSADRSWTVGDVRTDQTYANPSWITSLAWTKITGTPTTLAGYGITDGALNTTTLTINGVTFNLTANRTWNVGTVTSIATTGPITGGTITGSGTIGITQAGASSDGYLSSTDWNTFNSKQAAISVTAPLTFVAGVVGITQSGALTDGYLSSTDWNTFNSKVSGSGTPNTLPMWGSSTSLVNSPLSYASDTFNFQYNSATGGTVNFTNSNGAAYTYTIQMNNFGSPRSTIHGYTDGLVIQSIGGTQVSRIFANGNMILGTGTVETGHKLTISGDLFVNTIIPAVLDTDRFIVSDGGIIKYRTGAEVLADIGAQGSLTLTTTGTSGASTLIGNTLNIPQYTDQFVGTVTSVGLSMPSAFNVSNSPITSSGTIAVTAAGTASQYVRGDGTLADFPSGGGGGGSSVSYYLNGSVNQGTFVGNTYYEMSKTPVFGAGTDFSIAANGYVAQFITDAGDPNSLIIPAGNWNFETYFSASSAGGTPSFYVELYKYDGSTFTLIASNSTNPELIAFGITVNPYFSALAVPETILTVTDRIAIRIYVVTSGRTITLHTENSNLCQIVTTFTRGLTALNGLTAQVQYFQVGTSGTDFNIASSVATHTFNLPTASAVNRGALSSADWSTFNSKQNAITLTTTGTSGPATFIGDVLNVPNYTTDLSGYVTLATNQTITGLKTILRSGDVLNFKIGTDTLYGLKVAYNQNELAPSGEATWSFVNTFNNGSGTGLDTTPISFFRGVLVTGQRLVSASVNTNLLDYYGNNPSGRYPIYAYNTGVQQFASSIIVGETTGVVNAITGAISDLPAGVVANFKGRVIGSNAVNSNEFATLGQLTSGYVTAVTASSPLASSGGTTPNITIQQASGSQSGFLSSTDWTTFNNKQNALGYVPVPETRTITINGTSQDLSANRTYNVGTVTSVAALTLGTSGTDLSSTVANGTTTPVITLNVPTASATNRGALSAADWTTFNNKQNALTNPVTGTGSAGQVAYWSSSSAITGESNLFWDATNDRLGIGSSATPTPVAGVKFPLLVTSDAVTRIRIDSTQATPNAGVGLYANGVQKFSFAMFGTTSDFTIYNDALLSSSILVKGDTNNILINDNNDLGQKLRLGGRFALRASATASATTQVPVFVSDPSSTTTELLTRTPAQFRSDIGAQATLTNPVTGTGTTNYLPKFTGSTTIGNSNLVDVNGYLVLGNSSSAYGQAGRGTFEMNGSSDNIFAMRIGGGLSGYLYTNSSNMELYSTTNIQFSTAGAIRATLFSDGNFTLSNSPSNAGYKLDVNGTGRFSGRLLVSHATSGNYGAVIYNTSATGEGLTVRGGSTSSHSALIIQPYDGSVSLLNILATGAATFNLGSGEMRLNRTGTSEFLKLNTYYLLSDGNDQLLGSVTGATSIYAGNGVSPRLTITSGGNVGIGTTTYSMTAGYTGLGINNATNGGALDLLLNDVKKGELYITSSSFNMYGFAGVGLNLTVDNNSSKGLSIATTGAATFSSTLQTTHIGINNAPTLARLFATQTTDGEWIATFKNYGGSTSYGVSIDMSGSTSNQAAFQVYTSTGTGLKLANNGRLLLGTFTDLGYKLDVNGTGRFTDTITSTKTSDLVFTNASGGTNRIYTLLSNTSGYFLTGVEGSVAGSLVTGSTAYSGVITTNSTSDLVLGTNFTKRLSIDKSTGAATFSSSVTATAGIFNLNTTDGGFKVVGVNATPTNLAYLANNYFPKFYTRNHNFGITIFDQDSNNVGIQAADLVNGTSAKALIFNPYGGNVLIGTTTDNGAKLQVKGDVIIERTSIAERSTITMEGGEFDIKASPYNYNMRFFTGTGGTSTERMRIFSGGNVRIGGSSVTDNGNKLRVDGNIWLDAPTSGKVSIVNSSGVSTTIGVGATTGYVGTNSDHQLDFFTNNNVLATLKTDGQFEVQKIKTAGPTGGTAQPWRLGSVATVSPTSPNRTIEVEVNGTTYYLHAKTTNN